MKKRLLITSIVMMLVVAVALSTATYAWFTTSQQVSAEAVVLTASTMGGDAIMISDLATGVGMGNTITLTAVTEGSRLYPATPLLTSGHDFSDGIADGDFQSLINKGDGKFVDATSDMTENDKFYYSDTFYIFNLGYAGKRVVPVVTINYDPTSTTSAMAANSARIAIIERASNAEVAIGSTILEKNSASNVGAYTVKGIWEFNTASTANVYSKVASNAEFNSNATYYTRSGAGTDQSPYTYTAATVQNDDSATAATYYGTLVASEAGLYILTGNTATDGANGSTVAYSGYGVDGPTDNAYKQGNKEFSTSVFTVIPAATSGMQRGHEYTVVVWLEGWDSDCTNQITAGSFSVSLSFTAAN